MAEITREEFEKRAKEDPYAFMTGREKVFASEMEIVPIDATEHEGVSDSLSWDEAHIGSGGMMSVTDYGHHRNDCDTLTDFEEMIREKIRDSFGSQFLNIMDDEKERIAEKLLAISRKDGYVVVPHFED